MAVIALIAALAAAGGYSYLRRSLPQIDGTATVAGLTAPIEIIRDADAIPHIVAANKRDGLFGLGYAHAQDRLWQMEFQRRIGHGRLSEVLGAATLPIGVFEEKYRDKNSGTTWKDAKDRINHLLAPVIERGTKKPSLTRK